MNADEFRTITDFERSLKVGDEVELRWTNCNGFYRARARLTKVNRASVDGELLEPAGRDDYVVGRRIHAVRLTDQTVLRGWSANNGVFPIAEKGPS